MASDLQTDVLTVRQVFEGLKSNDSEVQLNAAVELRRYVSTTVAEMPTETASKLWDDSINRSLFDLMHSTNTTDKLGGLLAIDHLLEISDGETIDSNINLFRFFNYVKHLFPHSDNNLMLVASKTLGRIVQLGGSAFGERFMDYEVPLAIDLMRSEQTRYTGVLLLKEYARNSFGYSHTSEVVDNLLVALRDQRVFVRESAAELLGSCLVIDTQRGNSTYLDKVLRDAQAGLDVQEVPVLHGSLLTYRELLLHTGTFVKKTDADGVEKIMRFRTHDDRLVRELVIAMIPLLDTQNLGGER